MYFVIQITRDKSVLAKALYDYPDIISARSAYHSFLASALINADVEYALAEIIDGNGNVYALEVKRDERVRNHRSVGGDTVMKRKELTALIEAIQNLRNSADDETALASVYAYPEWRTDTAYTTDERIRYGENLYRCVQAHTSQNGWEPTQTPALWTKISLEEYPLWVQPTGSQDVYNTGDKVTYNGQHYISTVDANVWRPDVYGWERV